MRTLYRALLLLHPAAFEEKFGEELMWIFDIRDPEFSSSALILDCCLSLGRQWLFHTSLWAFSLSLLINCFVFQKMIAFFLFDIRNLLASLG